VSRVECPFEEDVLAAVATGRWPDRVDETLRAHVGTCTICHDLVNVAQVFAETVDEPVGSASPLPEPSRVWWTAQLRAREEAARMAARPITVTQAVAFAAIVGALGAVIGASSSWLQTGLLEGEAWLAQIGPRTSSASWPIATLLADHALIALGVVLCFFLTSLVAYFVLREN
jgi:hypothetical protein